MCTCALCTGWLPNVCTGRQAATLGSADHACPLSCCAPPPGNAPLCSAPDCSWAAAHPPLPTAAAHCSSQCMQVARGARQQQRRQVTATLLAAAAAVAAPGGGGGETWSPPCPLSANPSFLGRPPRQSLHPTHGCCVSVPRGSKQGKADRGCRSRAAMGSWVRDL